MKYRLNLALRQTFSHSGEGQHTLSPKSSCCIRASASRWGSHLRERQGPEPSRTAPEKRINTHSQVTDTHTHTPPFMFISASASHCAKSKQRMFLFTLRVCVCVCHLPVRVVRAAGSWDRRRTDERQGQACTHTHTQALLAKTMAALM